MKTLSIKNRYYEEWKTIPLCKDLLFLCMDYLIKEEKEGILFNDIEEGTWTEYYLTNEEIYSKGKYIYGKKEGIWKYWGINGLLKEQGNYVNNKQEGIWIMWSPYTYWIQRNYVNGKQEGRDKFIRT